MTSLKGKTTLVTGASPMSKKLEGKVALVTGGSRGIGAAIVKRLAADGARVAFTYTKGGDAATSVIKAIESTGGKAIAIQADATDAKAVNAAVEKAVASFGKLDVLVNNAGISGSAEQDFYSTEAWHRIMTVNATGVFFGLSMRSRP